MESSPSVAFLCATFLKPEMLHIHRHVTGLKTFRPLILAQKREGTWPAERIEIVPRSPWRFVVRAMEQAAGRPWQISRVETDRLLAAMADCQLLHVFFGNVAVHFLPLLRRCPVPVVVSFHGSDVAGSMASPGYADGVREMFHLAAAVPCRSGPLMDRVAALGCPRGKLRVMRTMVPDIPFRQRIPPPDHAWRIVQAARLVPKKGIGTALRAFADFHAEFPQSTFAIAGEGPMEAELRGMADDLQIANCVHFHGFLSQEKLQALFAESHIFLHPSETVNGDAEGVPNAMLEAMAGGLPVVTTRHGGISEVVTDGRNGLLCDEKNIAQLTAALRRLAREPETCALIAQQAASSVREQFSQDRQITAIETMYRKIIFSQSGSRPAK